MSYEDMKVLFVLLVIILVGLVVLGWARRDRTVLGHTGARMRRRCAHALHLHR